MSIPLELQSESIVQQGVLGKPAHIVIDEVTSSLRPIKECFTKENGYPEDLCITSETALHKVDSRTLVMVVDTNRPN